MAQNLVPLYHLEDSLETLNINQNFSKDKWLTTEPTLLSCITSQLFLNYY